mgnify:CR=1 FL=1
MRLLHTLLICLLLSLHIAANTISDYERSDFIETYAALAAEEMQRTGIPASITLAQAILESSWGKGKVAVEGNNFFGIKCYNGWSGPCVQAKDDEIGLSNFRFYESVKESFIDHSEFLKKDRYKPLFSIPLTEYAEWAKGLKMCGYATDADYADKLVKLIEEYALYLYDHAVPTGWWPILNTDDVQLEENQEVMEAGSFFPSSGQYMPDMGYAMQTNADLVMQAPSFNLGNNVGTRPAQQAWAVSQNEAATGTAVPQGQGKIRPLFPISDGHLERR